MLVQSAESVVGCVLAGEEKTLNLVSSQDAMLLDGEDDLHISLGQSQSRWMLHSFVSGQDVLSNHEFTLSQSPSPLQRS